LNLQTDAAEPYAACPFCLTEIKVIQLEKEAKPEKINEEKTSRSNEKANKVKEKEKPSACQYHLGYLSEREQKLQIPDACIVCPDIVDCMLHKMRA
jgi:uncharacterized Zn finger protein (UPF0148 family)